MARKKNENRVPGGPSKKYHWGRIPKRKKEFYEKKKKKKKKKKQ